MKKGTRAKTDICPVCGKHMVPYVGFKAGMIYECKSCGYRGPIALKQEEKQ